MKHLRMIHTLLGVSLTIALLFGAYSTQATIREHGPRGLVDTLNGAIPMADTLLQAEEQADLEPPIAEPDHLPSFKGGSLEKFSRWVTQRVRYPKEAYSRGIEGVVVVLFVVEADGSIQEEYIQILKSPDPSLSLEVCRLLLNSPKWTPAVQRGRHVRVCFTMPVVFKIPRPSSPQNHFPERRSPSMIGDDRGHSGFRRNSF
uniref:TonB family protein n=1 Tax=Alistipes sp. TaxID=1872444 RepID=UPI004055A494